MKKKKIFVKLFGREISRLIDLIASVSFIVCNFPIKLGSKAENL